MFYPSTPHFPLLSCVTDHLKASLRYCEIALIYPEWSGDSGKEIVHYRLTTGLIWIVLTLEEKRCVTFFYYKISTYIFGSTHFMIPSKISSRFSSLKLS